MIRPMASDGSALSSIEVNGHQDIHFVSSAPSIHSLRRVFPQYGWNKEFPFSPCCISPLAGSRLRA